MTAGRHFSRNGTTYVLACYATMERSRLEAVVFQHPRTGQFLILPRTQFEEEFVPLLEVGTD